MKPAPFSYYRPSTVSDAVDALASSDSAKVLAGGQSLIPTMNFRLALPELLVDIRRVGSLQTLAVGPDGVTIGACVTQSRVMGSDETAAAASGLRRALRFVGHLQIRNRGTVCGSLAHADPAAELPALAIASAATLTIRGPVETRTLAAEDFFLGPFWTDLAPDEILTEAHFPSEPSGTVTLVDEIARRSGDFAIVGIAAAFRIVDRAVAGARMVSFGVSGVATRMEAAERAVVGFDGGEHGSELYDAAYQDADGALDDVHATAEYRREALGALAVRIAGSATAPTED